MKAFKVGDLIQVTAGSDGFYKKGAVGKLVSHCGGSLWKAKFSGQGNEERLFATDCGGTWYINEANFSSHPPTEQS